MAPDPGTCILCGKPIDSSDQTGRIPSTKLLVHLACLQREMGGAAKMNRLG